MNQNITDIISRIRRDKAEFGITLYDGASPIDIAEFEKVKHVKLPNDFKELYRFCNGFESAEDMFRIIPLQEIIENRDTKYLVGQNDFHFAEYMIYCDMWTVSINSQDSQNYTIYREAGGMSVLTNSLTDFLNMFLNTSVYGLYQMEGKK